MNLNSFENKNQNSIKCYKNHIKSVWEIIKPYVHGKVIDIGGYDGSLLDFYSGQEKYVLDISSKALQTCIKKGYKVFKMDMHKINFKSNFFDTILLINTFEHSCDPYNLLRKLRKTLKNGGYLIIEVPNARSVRQISNLLFKNNTLPSGNSIIFSRYPQHMFQYTSFTLKKILEDCGFKVKIIGKSPIKQPFKFLFNIMPNRIQQIFATDIIAIAKK